MSSGPKQDESPSFINDQLMDDDEMMAHWRQVSDILKKRLEAAKKKAHGDPDNHRKALAYLKRSKEYYAYSRLIFLFGKMVRHVQEDLIEAGVLVPKPAPDKSELN